MEVKLFAAPKTYGTQTFAQVTLYSGDYLCYHSPDLLSKVCVVKENISQIYCGDTQIHDDTFSLYTHNLEKKGKKEKKINQ